MKRQTQSKKTEEKKEATIISTMKKQISIYKLFTTVLADPTKIKDNQAGEGITSLEEPIKLGR